MKNKTGISTTVMVAVDDELVGNFINEYACDCSRQQACR